MSICRGSVNSQTLSPIDHDSHWPEGGALSNGIEQVHGFDSELGRGQPRLPPRIDCARKPRRAGCEIARAERPPADWHDAHP
ncbi:hypothetical protein OKW38_001190 [Paraburkholderia sp. MM5496-R1]|uniref:hypothetical protein n=1 Tax=Paraburkholderia sp. MM5496-R1 TaxID=2991065 RepID=UPI003D1F38A2